MTREQFFILNFLVMGFFILLFFWGRKKTPQPSPLRVTPPGPSEASREAQVKKLKSSEEKAHGAPGSKSAPTPCIFMYNGHSWEAYEVLGLTPGASIESVKSSFEQSLQKAKPESHEFLKAALAAVLTDMKKRGYRPQ